MQQRYTFTKMKKFIIYLFLAILGFSSCKKDVSPASNPTIDEQARDTLYAAMNQYYFWYKLMPVVKVTDYKDPYTLLEAMRYKTLDRWSFVQTYSEYQAQNTGSFVGHGISLGLDPSNNVRIAQIYKNSPLYAHGVRRGWIVKKLNNTDLAPIFLARNATAYNQLIGPSTASVTNTFLFSTPRGTDTTIVSQKAAFTLNTVIAADTFHLKSGITGHLVFDEFIPPSKAELATAFAYFSQNNVRDIIVDLRYNGGGDLTVLQNMASYFAGAAKANTPFLTLTFNDKNAQYNQTYNFNIVSTPLSLSRMVVITTRGTASASEDFINGLKPLLPIVTIGDTTNGKPVGMIGIQFKTSYMFWPISFSLVNSVNSGDFYQGFVPAKEVIDDITHDWSDRNEACLKESIYYLEHGAVSAKGLYVGSKPSTVKFDEISNKNNNAYIIRK
jgi:carboxyl-terminal processing protease